MSDAKYFQRGKIQELRTELNSDKKDVRHSKKKVVMKKIVANMTMGNDMSPLFSDVIACMNIPVLEIKKMVYLYLINYARSKPDMALLAVNSFVKDVADPNPMIRALAIRTMGYIQVDKITDCLCEPLRHCLRDRDPYVCKTAAICVAKLYIHDRALVEKEGFIEQLRALLGHENSTVVANAVVALSEIAERSNDFELNLDISVANKLLSAINQCSEWGQTYILEALMHVVPQETNDAELLADRVAPRLQHANSAVVLTAVRVILYLTNYIRNDDIVNALYKKLGPPLVTLLHSGPEVQYVALRNILLILQRRPDFLKNEMKVFFCKYNDPIYVKLAKLEIMYRLANESNVDQVLPELKEYATEVDVDFVRKSVRSIGRCAIKIESAANRCIDGLVELIQTKVNYVVQEAVVVIKDIFRKYPNRYESIIGTLCENLDNLDEPEAKASMVWIIGQYADRIENADELLEQFLETFKDETAEVQLSLLTAIVKLFIKRPSVGQELVPKVLKYSTEEVDNPDLRDRGFIYWRLLSTNPVAAKAIVLSDKPAISTETDNMEGSLLDELLLHISTLASIYHKPPSTFIGGVKPRRLIPSKAFIIRSGPRSELPEELHEDPNMYNAGLMSNPYASDINPYSNDLTGGVRADGNLNNLLDLDIGGFEDGGGGLGGGADIGGAFDMQYGGGNAYGAAGADFGAMLFDGLGDQSGGQGAGGSAFGAFQGGAMASSMGGQMLQPAGGANAMGLAGLGGFGGPNSMTAGGMGGGMGVGGFGTGGFGGAGALGTGAGTGGLNGGIGGGIGGIGGMGSNVGGGLGADRSLGGLGGLQTGPTPSSGQATGSPFGTASNSPFGAGSGNAVSTTNSPFGAGTSNSPFAAAGPANAGNSPFGTGATNALFAGTTPLAGVGAQQGSYFAIPTSGSKPGTPGPSIMTGTAGAVGSDSSSPTSPIATSGPPAVLDPFAKTSSSTPAVLDPFSKTSATAAPLALVNTGGSARSQPSPLTPVNNPFAASAKVDASAVADVAPLSNALRDLSVGSAPPASVGRGPEDLFSLAIQSGYVPPKTLFLTAQAGKGLEIQGTFARRQGQMFMDMTFTNKALQPLTDFAILFNKNSFSLVPGTLEVRSPLFPNQSAETSLKIRAEGLPQLSNPVNNLQVAIKSTAGIVYFQTQFPLSLLFVENSALDAQAWLRMWKDEIPESNETRTSVPKCSVASVDVARNRLALSNVFTVAQRTIDNVPLLYTSVRLTDGSIFLSEIKFEPSLSSCVISTKTYATHLVPPFQEAVTALLLS